MNCKEIQDLILTDYLDGQMGDEQKKEIETHIANCTQCKEFELAARKTVIEPFVQAEKMTPPDNVWQQIKGTIEGQETEEALKGSLINDLIRKVRNFIFAPRPAIALAFGVVVVLVLHTVTKTTNNQQIAGVEVQDQIEYIAYLIDETDVFSMDANGDYGTDIEEYFL